MGHLVKCLHEDLSPLPRTHRKSQAEWHTLAVPVLGRWRLEPAGQPVYTSLKLLRGLHGMVRAELCNP